MKLPSIVIRLIEESKHANDCVFCLSTPIWRDDTIRFLSHLIGVLKQPTNDC